MPLGSSGFSRRTLELVLKLDGQNCSRHLQMSVIRLTREQTSPLEGREIERLRQTRRRPSMNTTNPPPMNEAVLDFQDYAPSTSLEKTGWLPAEGYPV